VRKSALVTLLIAVAVSGCTRIEYTLSKVTFFAYLRDAPSFDPAAQALSRQLRVEIGKIDDEQIFGDSIHRITIAVVRRQAAAEQRLVVTGYESHVVAVLFENPIGSEVGLEKLPRAFPIGAREPARSGANLAPVDPASDCIAAPQESLPGEGRIIVLPAGNVAPLRLLQRLDDRGLAGGLVCQACAAGQRHQRNERQNARPRGLVSSRQFATVSHGDCIFPANMTRRFRWKV